jgi:hypothetical protein
LVRQRQNWELLREGAALCCSSIRANIRQMISYRNDGKGCAAIADNVSKP